MEQRDRDNLKFLLTADSDTLREWYNTTSPEDHLYASSLLEVARLELLDKKVRTQRDCQPTLRILKKIFNAN